jgi:hypothetical protein
LEQATFIVERHLTFVERWLLLHPVCENVFPKLKWLGTQSELVELIYALHVTGSFGKTSLKEIFTVICKIFDCEIKNYSRLFWDIKNRKDVPTVYLRKITKALEEKIVLMEA